MIDAQGPNWLLLRHVEARIYTYVFMGPALYGCMGRIICWALVFKGQRFVSIYVLRLATES